MNSLIFPLSYDITQSIMLSKLSVKFVFVIWNKAFDIINKNKIGHTSPGMRTTVWWERGGGVSIVHVRLLHSSAHQLFTQKAKLCDMSCPARHGKIWVNSKEQTQRQSWKQISYYIISIFSRINEIEIFFRNNYRYIVLNPLTYFMCLSLKGCQQIRRDFILS